MLRRTDGWHRGSRGRAPDPSHASSLLGASGSESPATAPEPVLRRTTQLALAGFLLVVAIAACSDLARAGEPTEGVASWWHGDVAAVPDCTWPWTDCAPRRVTSQRTGISIVVTPAMYCQCYVGTSDERLIDLTASQVLALGLDPADGLFAVSVEPMRSTPATTVPDTAMQP